MTETLHDPSELEAQGWEFLDDGRFEEAMDIGHRLERLRWTGAFDLQVIFKPRSLQLSASCQTPSTYCSAVPL